MDNCYRGSRFRDHHIPATRKFVVRGKQHPRFVPFGQPLQDSSICQPFQSQRGHGGCLPPAVSKLRTYSGCQALVNNDFQHELCDSEIRVDGFKPANCIVDLYGFKAEFLLEQLPAVSSSGCLGNEVGRDSTTLDGGTAGQSLRVYLDVYQLRMLARRPTSSTKLSGYLFEVVLYHRIDDTVPLHSRSVGFVIAVPSPLEEGDGPIPCRGEHLAKAKARTRREGSGPPHGFLPSAYHR